jgi:uncharacterized protein YkwD
MASVLTPEYTGCGGQAPGPVNSAYEQQVVELVNVERTSRGLPPLKHVDLLDQAARYHASDMKQDGYFAHDTYDWVNSALSFTCSMAERITDYYPNWSWIGENIAKGNTTPQSVMATWMGSSGHRTNILHTEFREFGVGYYTGNYWVQDFGTRENVYPIIINNEAAETDNRQVSLYIYNRTSTSWIEMRLRNDNLSWTGWMPYQNTLAWNLPNAIGNHTVSVELRKNTITASSSDSIYLTTLDAPQLGNLPENLTFVYSIADHRFYPKNLSITPLNIGDTSTLQWEILKSGNWFSINPQTGTSPNDFYVTPVGEFTRPGSTYGGSATVEVTYPNGVVGSPQVIALTLNVIAEPIQKSYLPLLMASSP